MLKPYYAQVTVIKIDILFALGQHTVQYASIITALVQEVNGKEVQIQLTGFMEKNTVKFMKELWTLLLSAQKNASGVPQQFLDAKEEEIRKKKVLDLVKIYCTSGSYLDYLVSFY